MERRGWEGCPRPLLRAVGTSVILAVAAHFVATEAFIPFGEQIGTAFDSTWWNGSSARALASDSRSGTASKGQGSQITGPGLVPLLWIQSHWNAATHLFTGIYAIAVCKLVSRDEMLQWTLYGSEALNIYYLAFYRGRFPTTAGERHWLLCARAHAKEPVEALFTNSERLKNPKCPSVKELITDKHWNTIHQLKWIN